MRLSRTMINALGTIADGCGYGPLCAAGEVHWATERALRKRGLVTGENAVGRCPWGGSRVQYSALVLTPEGREALRMDEALQTVLRLWEANTEKARAGDPNYIDPRNRVMRSDVTAVLPWLLGDPEAYERVVAYVSPHVRKLIKAENEARAAEDAARDPLG